MTTKLEVLRAELEALEAADDYGAAHYDWLVEQVDELEAEERSAKPPTPQAPTTEPESDLVGALVADMERAAADPFKLSDAEREALVRRYNTMVVDTGRSSERVDVQALARDMTAAAADPSRLTDAERRALAERYNRAIIQGPERRTTQALRGELSSADLETRMRAAAALAARGELEDAEADAVVGAYNAEVQEAAASVGDPDAYPEELRPIVEGFREAQAALERPTDPVEAAVGRFNDYVRGLKPPTPSETLAALGVGAEPTGDGDE